MEDCNHTEYMSKKIKHLNLESLKEKIKDPGCKAIADYLIILKASQERIDEFFVSAVEELNSNQKSIETDIKNVFEGFSKELDEFKRSYTPQDKRWWKFWSR